MALIHADSTGSASQGLEFGGVQVGTVVTEATVLADGAQRSYKFTSSGAGAPATLRKAGVMADAGRRVSAYVKLGALPVTNTIALLPVQTSGGAANVFGLGVNTSGQLFVSNTGPGVLKTGTKVLVANTVYRISFAYVLTTTTNWTYKLWVDGILEFTATNADATLTSVAGTDLTYGWLVGASAGANVNTWIQHLYVDDSTALTDIGNAKVAAELPTTVNNNLWTGTVGGNGAVNERPINLTNFVQQTATSQATQDYRLQTAAAGDYDITNQAIVGCVAWVYAKASSLTGPGTPAIVFDNNGAAQLVTLTTTAALYTYVSTQSTYPSSPQGIGMRSSGAGADTILYECGALVAYIDSKKAPPIFKKPMRVWNRKAA